MLSNEYCEIFKTTHFEEHLRTAAFAISRLFLLKWSRVELISYSILVLDFFSLDRNRHAIILHFLHSPFTILHSSFSNSYRKKWKYHNKLIIFNIYGFYKMSWSYQLLIYMLTCINFKCIKRSSKNVLFTTYHHIELRWLAWLK